VSDRGRWGRGGAEASLASFAAATATACAVVVAVYPAYGTLTVETLAADATVAATPAVSDASTACAVSIDGAFSGDLGLRGTGSAYTPGVVRICILRRNKIRIHADAVYLITDKSLN